MIHRNASLSWDAYNYKYLLTRIDEIRRLLRKFVDRLEGKKKVNSAETALTKKTNIANPATSTSSRNREYGFRSDTDNSSSSSTNLPALKTLSALCGLSEFEESILVLCAGVELDGEIANLCAKAQGNTNARYVTFDLAHALLPHAHLSVLAPSYPLRRFRLVDLYGYPQTALTASVMHLEEKILHYIVGVPYIEKEILRILKPIQIEEKERILIAPSHSILAQSILASLKEKNDAGKRLPIVHFWGKDETSKLLLADWICNQLGLNLWELSGDLLPAKSDEMDSFLQLWIRESVISASVLYISYPEKFGESSEIQKTVKRVVERLPGLVFLSTSEQWSVEGRSMISIAIKKPQKIEQYQMWKTLLTEGSPNILEHEVYQIVNQFDLNLSTIFSIATKTLQHMEMNKQTNRGDDNILGDAVRLPAALWESCRSAARPKMAELASQINPSAKIEDLVLPEREKQLLLAIVAHVKNKLKVHEEWKFDVDGGRGLGVSALFVGESGTGKTMAAEVLANQLRLDLFRIDLSMVVSKYIGETEKNLRQVFNLAEDGSMILFFDEADALFGKRSEVKDSHDRFANIEIAYLLQRMENYRGVAVLATNMKNALDPAFLRRIRFVIRFPFPDEKSRATIWSRIFPKSVPTSDLDFGRLARLNISGGNIYSIALNASFLAAERGVPVDMSSIKLAAQSEYDKLERSFPSTEVEGW